MKNPFKSASHIEQEPKQNLSDLQFVASLQHKIDILESFIKHSLFNIYVNKFHCEHFLYVCDNMVFKECELDFSAIDWEQRRYELAKAAMQGILSDKTIVGYASSEADYKKGEKHTIPISIAKFAIVCADALINELK